MNPVLWETADPDRDDGIPRSPTRNTRAAYSNRRRTWYGWGSMTSVEKNWFGRILDDTVTVFADISVFGLPALLFVLMTYPAVDAGLTVPALTVWATMVGVAASLRGGWITPLGSETLGWVSTRYSLLVLRAVYYNATLAAAIYGSVAVETLLGLPGFSIVSAAGLGVVATLSFPTVADGFYHRLA